MNLFIKKMDSELYSRAVSAFCKSNKVKLLIATPVYGGLMYTGCAKSLMQTAVAFTKLDISFNFVCTEKESLIQRARNFMVAAFLTDKEATHLLFIDADITFSWQSIVQLLLADKEVSGGIYPKKGYNFDKIRARLAEKPDIDADLLSALSLDYVFNPHLEKDEKGQVGMRMEQSTNMIRVKDFGTGFMMIKKSAILKMIDKYPELKYTNNMAGYASASMDNFYSFFDCGIDPDTKVYLSEDYLFCKRWTDIGGEIWADLKINLNHTGTVDFRGALAPSLQIGDNLNMDLQYMAKEREKKLVDANAN